MLDHETRTAILRLSREGHGTRTIARAVGVSRISVRRVVAAGLAEVPEVERPDQLGKHIEAIRALHLACRGNLVRVHEELAARHGVVVPYSTLTRFCREAGLGVEPPKAAGRYTFEPGEEMQHDTSPHTVEVGGRKVSLQCASLVMCYSRRRYIQCYRRWNRFLARVFLTRALRFFEGAARRCMLDNSTVIMVGGTGTNARPAPEMKSFSDHFGFDFVSHRVGDANRSARVEAPFYHVENNFYPGRTFADLDDLNAQAEEWCRTYNATFHKSYHGIPDELGVVERLAGKPLPLHIPAPVEVHVRKADAEGYVRLHRNRYSVPEDRIGQDLEVHETYGHVRVFGGHRLVAEHVRHDEEDGKRLLLPAHRRRRESHDTPRPPSTEESALRAAGPSLAALCDALVPDRLRGRRALLRLHRLWRDYPTEAIEPAVARALSFGLTDPARIERMILKNLRDDFFRLPTDMEDHHG